jgi:hypothetical protein
MSSPAVTTSSIVHPSCSASVESSLMRKVALLPARRLAFSRVRVARSWLCSIGSDGGDAGTASVIGITLGGGQAATDFGEELVGLERLADEAAAAMILSPLPGEVDGGHDDDRDVAAALAKLFEEVPAVQDRQQHVQDDEVRGGACVEVAQGLLAVAGVYDVVALAAEGRGQALADHRVIFDDQESLHRPLLLGRSSLRLTVPDRGETARGQSSGSTSIG